MKYTHSTKPNNHGQVGKRNPKVKRRIGGRVEIEWTSTTCSKSLVSKILKKLIRPGFKPTTKTIPKALVKVSLCDILCVCVALYLKQVTQKNDLILNVVEQTPLEQLALYEDRWPMLNLRKSINKARLHIKNFAGGIIKHKLFETATISVILANSATLAMEDPQAVSTTPTQDFIENVFLGLYSTEMIFKILGMGFLFSGKDSYLRDPWNILDFIIVMSAYLTIFSDLYTQQQEGGPKVKTHESDEDGGLSLNSLRAFRVLRPLRAITSIKGLQVLVISVIYSIPLLKDTMLVLLSFFLIFAIAGTQLLTGYLKKRCVSIDDGTYYDNDYLCGSMNECPEGYFCGKLNENPNFGVTNFDNLLFSLLVVFQCITLEGWSDIMIDFQKTYSQYAFLLFLPIVFIGAFFLVNLTLAVINSSFKSQSKEQGEKIAKQKALEQERKKRPISESGFDEDTVPDEIGIAQFWIAQRASKKMIQLLRIRQTEQKKKQQEDDDANEEEGEEKKDDQKNVPKQQKNKKEDEDEEPIDVQVLNFLDDQIEDVGKASKKDKTKEVKHYAVNEMRVANRINQKLYSKKQGKQPKVIKCNLQGNIAKKEANQQRDLIKGAQQEIEDELKVRQPQASSDEGQPSQLVQDRQSPQAKTNRPLLNFNAFEDFCHSFDALSKADQNSRTLSSFKHPFDLSQNHFSGIDYEEDSSQQEEFPAIARKPKPAYLKKPRQKLQTRKSGLEILNGNDSSEMSSVIASDSSFEHNIEAFDENRVEQKRRKEAEERFLATQQANREDTKPNEQNLGGDLQTKQNQEKISIDNPCSQDLSHIQPIDEDAAVKKGKKKKKKKKSQKKRQDGGPEAKYQMRRDIFGTRLQPNPACTYMNQSRPINPLSYINKKTHKIEILGGMPYMSSSQNDVYEIRNQTSTIMCLQDNNRFIKANLGDSDQVRRKNEMEELAQDRKPHQFKAYQLKTCYQIQIEEPVEFDEDDDDALILALQPFDTVRSVGYGHLLTHIPIKFIARRSDIIVSSTLQLTLTPSDCGYQPKDHAKLSRGINGEIENWCNQRHFYRALDVHCAKLSQTEDDIIDQTNNKSNTDMAGARSTNAFPQKKARTLTRDLKKSGSKQLVSPNYQKKKTQNRDELVTKNSLLPYPADSEYKISQKSAASGGARRSRTKLSQVMSQNDLKDSIDLQLEREKSVILGPTPPPKQEQAYVRQIPPTLLTAPSPEKLNLMNEEEKRLYNIQKGKYDTYQRILAKKEQQGEHPKFTKFSFAEAGMIMMGLHHEDEEEDQFGEQEVQTNYFCRDETFKDQKLSSFENPPVKAAIRSRRKVTRGKHEYIPRNIIQEFDLPEELGEDYVNFNEVIIKDSSRKRKTPMWSGQDVLKIGLTTELSHYVISQVNAVRVWPKGIERKLKKARVLLKMIVMSDLFNNIMTLCVLLNTICMGMERYNMDDATIKFLEDSSNLFTWIFICEMFSKIIAIGLTKYLNDKMNWLDGAIVNLSILELILTYSGGSSGGDLTAFQTLRVLRTFRILRVARLLRALKSMKMIIAVIQRSLSSFGYITMLMFVFIFIYTLLGMQLFGGQFNFPDGKPRGNYDSFIIAFLTVFQVLTTENWNSVLYDSMRSPEVGQFVPVIYYVSWIFIGNFILLNLFLAILLDGFFEEGEDEEIETEETRLIEQEKRKVKIQEEKIRRLTKMGANVDSLLGQNKEPKKNKEEEYIDDIDDLNIETVREIFMDEGIIKKKDKERERKNLYKGISCEQSLYLFSKQNRFRLAAYKIYKHKAFDNIIMGLIGLSSVKLAADSYLIKYGEESQIFKISEQVDIVLNICFLFECVTKNVAMGCFMEEGSYLRESWNQLDMFIVFTSMLDMALANVDLPVIKILRLLRTLRPLRVISHNVAMKLIVVSLFESVGAIFNVLIVVLAVWLMFAIFAINIFAGKFFYCSIAPLTYHTKYECNVAGGSWLRAEQNFDDIFQAMLTLFNVASLEGWPDVMMYALDVTEVDQGPKYEYSVYNGFFFIVFILIGSFFLLNMFVGVLFLKYGQAAKVEQKGYTEENLVWLDIQKMIVEQKCPFEKMHKPSNKLHPQRYKYWKIVISDKFEIFIMSVIVLNIVQMGINFENAPPSYVFLLGLTDYVFTVIFIAEAYCKMRAYVWRYFDTVSNQFDFFIVISSVADIIMGLVASEASDTFSMGPQIARMLRVLRVTRIVRLAKKNQGLQALMQTITLSIGALFNVFLLLMLCLFIFAILAVFFFGNLTAGNVIDEYRNFNDFGQSFLFLFVISTGENWNMLMYDCNKTQPNCVEGVDCGTSFAPAFFIVFVLFVQNVMLNLFILVILNQFEKYMMSADSAITKFKKNLDVFMETWVEFTATASRCVKLREKRLQQFFKQLPPPIGLPTDLTEDQMKKIMLKMGIKCDDGYVYFNELLYRCMRRRYGSFKLNKRMQIHEIKTQYKIYQLKLSHQSLFQQKDPYEIFFAKTVGKGKTTNPFLQYMYFQITFNSWFNYAKKVRKREKHKQKQEQKKLECEQAGIDFVEVELVEQRPKRKYVQIEVEEDFYQPIEEGESESPEEEPEQPLIRKKMTLMDLKRKKTMKPFASMATQKQESQHVYSKGTKAVDPSRKGYNFLKLLKLTAQHSNYVYQIQKDKLSMSKHRNAAPDAPTSKLFQLDDFTASGETL